MEKEHQVLKEQLKEAQEKYEQLQSRSLEEISALKELLKKNVEETEVVFLSVQQWDKLQWLTRLVVIDQQYFWNFSGSSNCCEV